MGATRRSKIAGNEHRHAEGERKMPEALVQGVRVAYDSIGDGFPLVLLAQAGDQPHPWRLFMPLLGEFCRTLAYTPAVRAADVAAEVTALLAFLDALSLERVYLAGQAATWPVALQCCASAPARLAGLILVGPYDPPQDVPEMPPALADAALDRAVPTLLVVSIATPAHQTTANTLAARHPHWTRVLLPAPPASAAATPPTASIGHAIVRFLIHWERRRTMVRGASLMF